MTENIEYIFPIGKLSGINCLKGNMLNMIKPIILPLRWTYKKKKTDIAQKLNVINNERKTIL